jgi:hypothetical protein
LVPLTGSPKKLKNKLFKEISIINLNNTNKMQSNNNNNYNNNNNNNYINPRPVTLWIKEAFTATRSEYLVFTDWTTMQMMDALKPQIVRDFNVERDRFYLIPYGQEEAEEGYSINNFRYRDLQLRQIWDYELNMGFYLHRIHAIDLTNED